MEIEEHTALAHIAQQLAAQHQEKVDALLREFVADLTTPFACYCDDELEDRREFCSGSFDDWLLTLDEYFGGGCVSAGTHPLDGLLQKLAPHVLSLHLDRIVTEDEGAEFGSWAFSGNAPQSLIDDEAIFYRALFAAMRTRLTCDVVPPRPWTNALMRDLHEALRSFLPAIISALLFTYDEYGT